MSDTERYYKEEFGWEPGEVTVRMGGVTAPDLLDPTTTVFYGWDTLKYIADKGLEKYIEENKRYE